MCGVIGLWRPRRVGDDRGHGSGDDDVRRAHRLLDRIQHRGPDGRAIWHRATGDSVVTLGLVRLAIVAPDVPASVAIDEGHRPGDVRAVPGDVCAVPGDVRAVPGDVRAVRGDVIAAVTNGELYNHAALRRRVAAVDTVVDTALVPALFRAFGPAFAREVRGMFGSVVAVAGRLHLFRDPLGKKPLFYRRRGDGWVVASEQKGLFDAAGVTPGEDAPVVDPVRAARAFRRGFLDDDEPLLLGVHAVPPGGHVVLDGDGARVERVVAFDDVLSDRRARHSGVDDDGPRRDVDRLEALLGRANSRRVTRAVPARVLLSGGMDSGIILAHARRPALGATTLAMPGERDERAAAARVARRLKRPHDVVTPRPPDRHSLRRVLWHTETPDVAGSWQMGSALLDHAAAMAGAGVRVVLSGEGADELFLGYPWLRLDAGVLRGRRHDDLAVAWARERQRRPGARAFERWRSMLEENLVPGLASAIDSALPRLFPVVDAASATTGALPSALSTTTTAAAAAAAPHRARALQLEALQQDMLTLPVLHADRLWMAHGVEARLPFLDVDVVRAALRLPASSLLSTRSEKPLVRQLYARALGRPAPAKRGFSGARRPADDLVLAMADGILERGPRVVHGPALSRLRQGGHDGRVVELLWRVVVIEECADVLCGGGP